MPRGTRSARAAGRRRSRRSDVTGGRPQAEQGDPPSTAARYQAGANRNGRLAFALGLALRLSPRLACSGQPRRPAFEHRAPLARLAGAPPAAAAAFAVRAPDHVPEVIDAIVVGDFLARLDVAQRPDEHPVLDVVYFRVGIAGMIEVARDIAARRAVDGPAAVDFVEVQVAARLDLVGFLGGELAALVFGNPKIFADRPGGENA